jgi:hypothetical protein
VKYSVVGLGVHWGLKFQERGLRDLRFVLGRNIQENTRCLLEFIRRADD